MRYQNRLMSNEDDIVDNNVMVENNESSSRLARAFFTLQNPIFIPSLIGSMGVFLVFVILCRSRLYRIIIHVMHRNGLYHQKSSNTRLKQVSKPRQSPFMSSFSKP